MENRVSVDMEALLTNNAPLGPFHVASEAPEKLQMNSAFPPMTELVFEGFSIHARARTSARKTSSFLINIYKWQLVHVLNANNELYVVELKGYYTSLHYLTSF